MKFPPPCFSTSLQLMRGCLPLAMTLLLLAILTIAQTTAQPVTNESIQAPAISELIQQLGDPRYAERRFAERALQRLGLAAFDELLVASDHSDPEIAATSQRLLSEATKDWHRESDPDRIRLELIRYAKRSEDLRILTIELMNRLPDDQAVEALCRIARYETSEQVSKAAAAALFQNAKEPESPISPSHFEAIRRGLNELQEQSGPTDRHAIVWLNQFTSGNADSLYWLDLAENELRLIEQGSADTNQQIIERLLWLALSHAVTSADEQLVIEITKRLIDLKDSDVIEVLLSLSKRLANAQQLDTLQKILDIYQPKLQGRRGLYLRARVALTEGDVEQAAELASQALAIPAGGDTSWLVAGKNEEYRQKALLLGERILIAEELDKEGRGNKTYREWACRELEAVSDQLDPVSVSVVYARWKLAELRHDSEAYTLAAETLVGLVELISSSKDQRRHYSKLSQQAAWLPLPDQTTLIGQHWLYEALAKQQQGDVEQAASALEKSYNSEPTNADVLIAMYRLEDQSLEYMTRVRERILAACRRLEVEIAQDPTSPTPYNHWAWLVSNTEGDYAKAVRYSERSLALSPDNPGYLDTLGRCLFSAGRIDEAIESQQRAVEQMPSMQIMQRQLDLFYEAQNR